MVLQWKALAPSVLGLPLTVGGPGGWVPEFTAITGKALMAISAAMTNATVTNTMMRLIGTTSFDSGRDSSAPPCCTTGARMTRYKGWCNFGEFFFYEVQ
jgi:hypothetical protein